MRPTEVASKLHENERKVLHALGDEGTTTTEKLAQMTGLGKDAVEKASDWAATKGVVVFNEEVSQFFALTDEGDVYSENGLPEKNLLNILRTGPKAIGELQKSFDGVNIALAWIRRNGWADIDKGVLSLSEYGKSISEIPEEKIIKKLREVGKVNSSEFSDSEHAVLDQLIKRKLVTQSDTVTRYVAITDFGKQVLPELELNRVGADYHPVITRDAFDG